MWSSDCTCYKLIWYIYMLMHYTRTTVQIFSGAHCTVWYEMKDWYSNLLSKKCNAIHNMACADVFISLSYLCSPGETMWSLKWDKQLFWLWVGLVVKRWRKPCDLLQCYRMKYDSWRPKTQINKRDFYIYGFNFISIYFTLFTIPHIYIHAHLKKCLMIPT